MRLIVRRGSWCADRTPVVCKGGGGGSGGDGGGVSGGGGGGAVAVVVVVAVMAVMAVAMQLCNVATGETIRRPHLDSLAQYRY
jgi:hypothetical protein